MVLLASKYDQSRFLKAADLTAEKKFKIKAATEERVGIGKDQEMTLPARAGTLEKYGEHW